MRTTIKKTETVENEYLVGVTCDRCGKESNDENWLGDSYDFDEVEIERRHGTRYPEGGSTEVQAFDLCPDCFIDLSEWIGKNPRVINSEY